jgi:hypothetical protein
METMDGARASVSVLRCCSPFLQQELLHAHAAMHGVATVHFALFPACCSIESDVELFLWAAHMKHM